MGGISNIHQDGPMNPDISDSNIFHEAGKDFYYLLNRGFPRKAALELVGNRYDLTFDQRHLLHRGVFSRRDAALRRKRRVLPEKMRGNPLAIDGHNVLITIEAALSGRPLVFSNDGFIRDISGLSGAFKQTKTTADALNLVMDLLNKTSPCHTLFLLDSPISSSGLLAREVRRQLLARNLPGDAIAMRVPENLLVGFDGIVATSDTAILDQSPKVFDLAGYLIRKQILKRNLIRIPRFVPFH